MTKHDLSDDDGQLSDGAVLLRRGLIGVGGGLALVFIAGMIAGYTAIALAQGGIGLVDVAILAAMLAALGGVAFAMWRVWPRRSMEPEAPRIRSARMLLLAAFVVSVPIGIILSISDGGATALFSDAPLTPGIAATLIALWFGVMPAITWLWWRRVDEHEADAYRVGGFVAAHAYMFIAPAWWLASRAGWLPVQEPMVVLLMVSVVWSIVWFAKKYF